MAQKPKHVCDFSLENEQNGIVCGLDEVGRGPLAGPVVAACVYIPPESHDLEFIEYIKDSKKVTDIKTIEETTKILLKELTNEIK